MRTLASDYRQLSLTEECDAARRVLQAARIRTTVTTAQPLPALPAKTETALATVLREGVANILRHSRAPTCTITITTEPTDTETKPDTGPDTEPDTGPDAQPAGITLTLTNDGTPRTPSRHHRIRTDQPRLAHPHPRRNPHHRTRHPRQLPPHRTPTQVGSRQIAKTARGFSAARAGGRAWFRAARASARRGCCR
ncbi:hypothetical protein GCM10009838_66300 [Catenulispora subtropica]|uniref:Histidine kinase n=1 Tax=Catenulispora subtropica TaxID=450798 RepID=A0ABN2SV20_9ACTN